MIEVNRKAGRFVLSEKLAAWIAAAQQLEVDEIREGKVDSLTDFGAFIDIKFPDGESRLFYMCYAASVRSQLHPPRVETTDIRKPWNHEELEVR